MRQGKGQARLTADEVMAVLRQAGVVREGHFRLTSGLHTDLFLLCSLVQQHPHHAERLGQAMARPFREAGVEVVVGTAMGGVILGYEVARALGVRAIYAEKTPQRTMVLRRGFSLRPGERVLLVEDALSTGGSVRSAMAAIAPYRPQVVGVSVLVDRSGGRIDLGVPLAALVTLDVGMWAPDACPLCREGVPLVEPKEMVPEAGG